MWNSFCQRLHQLARGVFGLLPSSVWIWAQSGDSCSNFATSAFLIWTPCIGQDVLNAKSSTNQHPEAPGRTRKHPMGMDTKHSMSRGGGVGVGGL